MANVWVGTSGWTYDDWRGPFYPKNVPKKRWLNWPTGEYKDRYPLKTLRQWADTIKKWKRWRLAVYCYFDNDQKSAAPKDARRLTERLSGKRGR